MTVKMIEQLWYTWSNTGIHEKGLGLQIRAASPGLLDAPTAFYQSIGSYINYRLPDQVEPETTYAPICLALRDTPYGRILVHKIYIGRDLYGRTGNFFTHLLLGLPEDFTARDAIELWESPLWGCSIPGEEQSTTLPRLSLGELKAKEQSFDFTEVQDELYNLIIAFLAPNRLQQRVTITGGSQQIAMLVWGLSHSLPKTLLPPEFTFTTYEYDIRNSRDTIVGTTIEEMLPEYNFIPLVTYLSEPQKYPDRDVQIGIEAFAQFAIERLVQAPNGYAPELSSLIEQAEEDTIVDVQTFIRFFKENVATEKIEAFAQAVLRNDWVTVAQLRDTLTMDYPPTDNREVWETLFHNSSKEMLREPIILHKATYQWLFKNVAKVSPQPNAVDLYSWLRGNWKRLEMLLSLEGLSDSWYEEAIAVTLLAPQQQKFHVMRIYKEHEQQFTNALQQIVVEHDEESIEAVLDFFSYGWEPDMHEEREHLLTTLINTQGIQPQLQYQLRALIHPAHTSATPRGKMGILQTLFHITILVFAPFKKALEEVMRKLSKLSRIILFSLIILLLLCSNALTYYASTTRLGGTSLQGTSTAQVRQTTLPTLVPVQHDNDQVITSSPPLDVKINNKFTFYVEVQNNGTSTWSDDNKYAIVCIPDKAPDCANGMPQGFMGYKVAPKQSYVFIITLVASLPANEHHILLSLARDGKPFGPTQKIVFTVST